MEDKKIPAIRAGGIWPRSGTVLFCKTSWGFIRNMHRCFSIMPFSIFQEISEQQHRDT
jgi:hypothetical protein